MYAVKFGADWCLPCRRYDPVLAELVESKGYEIHDVDVDELDSDTVSDWKISGIPATFFFDNNDNLIARESGAITAQEFVKVFNNG